MLHNKTIQTLRGLKSLRFHVTRLAITLAIALLTATTAWAKDVTVTYNIKVSGNIPQAHITNAETGNEVATWNNSIRTLWPAGVTHTMSDYDISFKPDYDLDKTDKDENGRTLSSSAFRTEENETTFTVAIAGTSRYYIKSVTFKENRNGNVTVKGDFSGFNPKSKSVNVTLDANKFFNVITVVLTDDVPVSYIGLDGTKVTGQMATIINADNMPTTLSGWYVVQGTVNYTEGLLLDGDTHIILADGASLNIGTEQSPVKNVSPFYGRGFFGDQYDLSIYGQSGNTGTLTIYSKEASFLVNNLTIAGGNIHCNSSIAFYQNSGNIVFKRANIENTSGGGLAIWADNLTATDCQLQIEASESIIQVNNAITFNNVSANLSGSYGVTCASFTVNHSRLEVFVNQSGAIHASGIITLGCTDATDYIKTNCSNSNNWPNSYSGTVKIADGQTLYAGSNAYTGTLTDAERMAIGGQKLTNVAPPTFSYIGLDGAEVTGQMAVIIDADNMPTSLSGWYIVQGTVNYTTGLKFSGETHIILADNAVMNVSSGSSRGIESASGSYSLFVHGQSGRNGKLTVTSSSGDAVHNVAGDITIVGCEVEATGSKGIFVQKYNGNGGNLTIKDATVKATGTSRWEYGIHATGGGDITIDNSNVNATSLNYRAIQVEYGGVTIQNGGKTIANGADYGICALGGNIAITGCEVEATGARGIYAEKSGDNGNVTIQNATVKATGTSNYGIQAYGGGDITLNLSDASDYITVSSYAGTVKVADGKALTDGNGHIYTGTLTDDEISAIAGKTLSPLQAISYIAADGETRQCTDFTVLAGNETELDNTDGWYVAIGTLNYDHTLTISANVNLILADGCQMNIGSEENRISGSNCIYGKKSLTIYGQSTEGDGMGKLNAYSSASSSSAVYVKNYTQHGGAVTIDDNSAVALWLDGGDLTLTRGTLTATATGNYYIAIRLSSLRTANVSGGTLNATGYYAISGALSMTGGTVTLNGGKYAIQGNATLGWTTHADRFKATGTIIGTVTLTSNFTDGNGHIYAGTLTDEEMSAIAGKTLSPIEAISYIDADGKEQWCTGYTTLTEDYLTSRNDVVLTAGAWYVVKDDLYVTGFSNNFTVSGSGAANIILCDGKEFDFTCSNDGYILGSLNIYGQSEGTGKFNFNNNYPVNITNKTELIEGDLTIYGGQVVLVGRDKGEETYSQRAIVGNVTICRGSLYAKGGDNAGRDAIYGNVTFRGGSLTAIGGSRMDESSGDGVGIDGNVSLDWSNAGDNIYASSYTYSPFTIADGKAFTDDDGNYYSGTLTDEEKDAIGGKTLRPCTSFTYLADGKTRQCTDFTVLTGNETELDNTDGWYVAAGTLNYDHTLTISADVNLILTDGCQMNFGTSESRLDCYGINYTGYPTLNIYGQSTGDNMGTLSAYTTGNEIHAIRASYLRINGGNVVANAIGDDANGLDVYDDLIVNDGNVIATATGYDVTAISTEYNLHVNGGNVTATANGESAFAICVAMNKFEVNGGKVMVTVTGDNATAIGHHTEYRSLFAGGTITVTGANDNGNIYLNGATVTFSSYGGYMEVGEGLFYTDGEGNYYYGELTSSEMSAIAGKTLSPSSSPAISLADTEQNQKLLALDGVTLDVTLANRTIDTEWNTLTVPFNVTYWQLIETFGKGVKLYELTGSSLVGDVLGLEFTSATSIEVGKPYFIKASADVVNPTFHDVTIDAWTNNPSATDYVDFIPTLGVTKVEGSDLREVLVLGGGNTLYNPASLPAMMKGFRGYFRVHDVAANAAQFRMSFDEESEISGIFRVASDNDTAGCIYNLMGQKVNRADKGLFIVNGKRVMVKP